ncbi:MAG: SycD/LcrH family type III secretion system chaperone [Parachlamydiaceae bacterium]
MTVKNKELGNSTESTQDILRDKIKDILHKKGSKLSKEEKKAYGKILVKIFEKEVLPKDALKISDQDIVDIYFFGLQQFSMGKYREAKELFRMLTIFDFSKPDYFTSLGVCCHRLKEYQEALGYYMGSIFLKDDDPTCFFYSYDCYMNINNKLGASLMLSNAIEKSGDKVKYADLKKRAQALLAILEKT